MVRSHRNYGTACCGANKTIRREIEKLKREKIITKEEAEGIERWEKRKERCLYGSKAV
jgi:hypothetical protein